MKRISVLIAVVVFALLLVAGGAYSIGSYHGEQQAYSLVEKTAVDQLASQLYMLRELEKGNVSDVRRILQAGTGAQLDWIIDYGDLNRGAASLEYRCKLLSSVKTYRDDHALFKTAEWNYLWQVRGMKEAEERREAFLNRQAPVICNWKN